MKLAVQQLIAGIGAEGKVLDVLVDTVSGYAGGVKLWEPDTRVLDQIAGVKPSLGFHSVACSGEGNAPTGKGAIVNVASKAALDHGAGVAAYAASNSQ